MKAWVLGGLLSLGLLFAGAGGPPSAPAFLDVTLVRQSTTYSCGAAALLSVFSYFGIHDYTESDLMKELGTTANGSDIRELVRVANEHNLGATFHQELTIDQLRAELAQKRPVIIEMQAWGDPVPASYKEIWNEGHFAIVIAIDEENIYFVDPSLLGSRGKLRLPEFEERWHELSEKKVHEFRTGIIFTAKSNPPPAWEWIH